MGRESAVEGAKLLKADSEQGEMAAFILGNLDEVGEELGGHGFLGAEASNDVPGEIDSPALSVDQTVEDGLPAVKAAAFSQFRHQVRGNKLYLN